MGQQQADPLCKILLPTWYWSEKQKRYSIAKCGVMLGMVMWGVVVTMSVSSLSSRLQSPLQSGQSYVKIH